VPRINQTRSIHSQPRIERNQTEASFRRRRDCKQPTTVYGKEEQFRANHQSLWAKMKNHHTHTHTRTPNQIDLHSVVLCIYLEIKEFRQKRTLCEIMKGEDRKRVGILLGHCVCLSAKRTKKIEIKSIFLTTKFSKVKGNQRKKTKEKS